MFRYPMGMASLAVLALAGLPAYASDSADLHAMKHWTWFQTVVQFNTAKAVKCGIRDGRWKARVDFQANVQIHRAGEYEYVIPRMTVADRKAWLNYRERAKADARNLYDLPCAQFATLLLLKVYDRSAKDGTQLPIAAR